MKKLIFLLAFAISSNLFAINDFSSDGCSMYPDGIPGYESNQWFHCCFTHDMAYWVGGEEQDKVDADYQLDYCVSDATFGAHGTMMRLGVEIGGLPDTGLSWRWGYGFKEDRSYKNMSFDEKKEAFSKYDQILDTILKMKDHLKESQKSYMLGRYELLRHQLAEQLNLSYDEEVKGYDKRYKKVQSIYQYPVKNNELKYLW